MTYAIIGCAQTVHGALGPGFPEEVYHRALAHELTKAKLPFESERLVEVFYDGVLCGEFRPDLVVDDKVIVELKAVESMSEQHLSQTISYLKATGLKVGLILNFGHKSLQAKRVAL